MFNLLFEGLHTNHHGDGFYKIDPLTSSVSLVQHDGVNIVIDTGSLHFEKQVIDGLKKHDLSPADINFVCNSHYHLDHLGNNHLFRNAVNYISVATMDYKTGVGTVYGEKPEKRPEIPGVKCIPTPGHTIDHYSYLHKDNEGVRYICAGDAVREDIIRSEERLTAHFGKEFWESCKKIFETADVVVPGHGRIIEGELKDELFGLIEKHYAEAQAE